MISVLDNVKTLYKSDSVMKNYFIVFRDKVGTEDTGEYVVLTNEQIKSESLQVIESICSSGNFKIGLCESACAKVAVRLTDNVKGNEVFIFQVLNEFNPDITIDPIKGVQLSGEGVTELSSTFSATNIISGLSSNNFSKDSNYLIFAKLKYIGDPIYLYVETTGRTSRLVYYLKPGLFNFSNIPTWSDSSPDYPYDEGVMVLHSGYIYQSLTYENSTEPSDNVNSWKNITRYVQVVIPIIGTEFYENKMAIYVNTEEEYGTLEGQATIYEISKPVMPLGLFSIKSCKRSNDGLMRDLECFDRMQDVGLNTDIYLSGATSTQLGLILNQAAEGTQIVIGSNLSKEAVTPIRVSTEVLTAEDVWIDEESVTPSTDTRFPDFPSGTIYEVEKHETQIVQGIYSESQSVNCTLDHVRYEQTYKDGQNTANNNGVYSHTQMQIIDGDLDETATSSNKEYSTTIYKTMRGQLIDSDNANWSTTSGAVRKVSGQRQQSKNETDNTYSEEEHYVQVSPGESAYYSWGMWWYDYAGGVVVEDGPYGSDSGPERPSGSGYWLWGDATNGRWIEYEWIEYHEAVPAEYEWEYDSVHSNWSYSVGSKKTYSNLEYEVKSASDIGSASQYKTESGGSNIRYVYYKRTVTFKRYTDVGYYYSGLDSSWKDDTTTHTGKTSAVAQYFTGQSKSGWIDTSGNTPWYNYAYLDIKKTLYWKYTWDILNAKGTGDTNWVWYDTKAYQSSTSGSGAKYALTSTRPADYYSKLNTVYSVATVYKKMSKRYTRTHKYNYTFTTPSGTGWSVYYTADSKYDTQHNYLADTTSSNRQYTGVTFDASNTFTNQKKVGVYSNKNVYYNLRRDYRRAINYGYIFYPPEGSGWSHTDPDYNKSDDAYKYRAGNTQDGITQINDVYNVAWRNYKRTVMYRWIESAMLKRTKYAIPAPPFSLDTAYSVYLTYPTDSKAYTEENTVRELASAQIENYTSEDGLYSVTGTFNIDRQNAVHSAILDNSSATASVEPGSYVVDGVTHTGGVFTVYWIYDLVYNCTVQYGSDSPIQDYSLSSVIYAENPYLGCDAHSQAEKFNDMPVIWGKETIHGTRRSIIAGFLELHGMFINFDRWGVSTIRNVKASTLYPAENLYPHDSSIPGLEVYGDIYPSIGSTEVTPVSVCKSIYIDDDLNMEFDGVLITKESVTPVEASIFPFYYNRLQKRYGALPSGMPEIGYWEGNNYYKIENNFFFDNFIFGSGNTESEQRENIINNLKEICKQILSIIGNLQYFNLTAELRALPYMEVGDSININTPQNGYETAILRRIMKGCLAQMDSIETDFYD